MLNDTAKNMQTIICQAIDSGNYYAAYEALIIYTQTFLVDDFVEEYKWLINEYGPQVSVICLDNNESAIDEFIKMQTYKNIELAKLSEEDSNADIIEYIKATSIFTHRSSMTVLAVPSFPCRPSTRNTLQETKKAKSKPPKRWDSSSRQGPRPLASARLPLTGVAAFITEE